jgi:hypothetical protein
MSILNYISDKKAKFKANLDAKRSQDLVNKKLKLLELQEKNKKLDEELKINRSLEKLETQNKEMRKENFRSTIAGKIATNIKAKVNENKKKNKNKSAPGNIFTQQATYNNPFTRK